MTDRWSRKGQVTPRTRLQMLGGESRAHPEYENSRLATALRRHHRVDLGPRGISARLLRWPPTGSGRPRRPSFPVSGPSARSSAPPTGVVYNDELGEGSGSCQRIRSASGGSASGGPRIPRMPRSRPLSLWERARVRAELSADSATDSADLRRRPIRSIRSLRIR